MFIVVEFIEAEPQHRAGLRAALVFLARSTIEKRRGCQRFDVGQDDLDATTLLLYQVYDSKAAYTEHLEKPEYAEHRLLVDPWTRTRRVLTYDLVPHGGVA